MVSPEAWAPVPASAVGIGFHECKQEGVVGHFGALEQYRELTETCKVFEDCPGLSFVMEPKETDSLCELVGHHTGSGSTSRGFALLPGLDVPWHVAGN